MLVPGSRASRSDAETLSARLVRMKLLIESLEITCTETDEHRETFRRLKREMDAACATVQTVQSPTK